MDEDNSLSREKAEEELEEAIKKWLIAVGHDEGLLVDWLLITANHIEDGVGSGTANAMYGPRHQRLYNAAGLIKYAELRLANRINNPD